MLKAENQSNHSIAIIKSLSHILYSLLKQINVGTEIMAEQNRQRHSSCYWLIIYESHLVGTNMTKASSKYETIQCTNLQIKF